MKRREFIGLIGGGAAAWPFATIAQQDQRMKLIGVFPSAGIDQSRVEVLLQAMQQLGWSDSRNVRFDIRLGAGDPETNRKRAEEMVALAPAIIVAFGSSAVAALLQATRSVPVVFAAVADPVGAGYVASLARPGGNATGFLLFEYGVSGKWLELLKQIAPSLKRAAVLRDPTIPAGIGQFAIIQSVSPSLGVDVIPIPISVVDAAEIERSIATFADSPNGGLILTASALSINHRDLVIALAARYKLPAVYWDPRCVGDGGLMAYGPDVLDQYRRAAGYVDCILKGEKPADLPVQAPTKYELMINAAVAPLVSSATSLTSARLTIICAGYVGPMVLMCHPCLRILLNSDSGYGYGWPRHRTLFTKTASPARHRLICCSISTIRSTGGRGDPTRLRRRREPTNRFCSRSAMPRAIGATSWRMRALRMKPPLRR